MKIRLRILQLLNLVGYFRWVPNVTGGEKNIGPNQDSNSGPQEYRPCTLPLSYGTTC